MIQTVLWCSSSRVARLMQTMRYAEPYGCSCSKVAPEPPTLASPVTGAAGVGIPVREDEDGKGRQLGEQTMHDDFHFESKANFCILFY